MYKHVSGEHCFSKHSPLGEVRIHSKLQVFLQSINSSDMQIDHICMCIFIFAYNL